MDNYRSSKNIDFSDFLNYLKLELFGNLPEPKEKNANVDLSKVDDVCWMLCYRKFVGREKPLLNDQDAYRIWRLFNFLAETDQNGAPLYPVIMDSEELALSIEKLLMIIGQAYSEEAFQTASEGRQQFDYLQVLHILESHYLDKLESDIISAAIKEVYDDYVTGVLKKVR